MQAAATVATWTSTARESHAPWTVTHVGDESWRAVDAALRRLAARKGSYDAEEARWLRAGQASGVHLHLGFGSYLEYLERVLGYGPRLAAERLRVAEMLAHLPALERALADNELSWSAVRELTRVALPATEAAWLTAARGQSVRDIEALVTGHGPGDLPDDNAHPELIRKLLRFEVSAETWALFREARRHVESEAGERLSDDQVLGALARAALGGPAEPGRASHQIAVTVCPHCERATVDGAGQTAPIGPATVARARCDGQEIESPHLGPAGRATQTVPPATRRLVGRRDHGRCQVPGCRAARYLDIHHIVPRAEGGTHEPGNLTTLCGVHHDAVHHDRLRIHGTAPDRLRFTHADGREYGAAAPTERDVLEALRRLGCAAAPARAALTTARAHVGDDASREELLRASLQALGPRWRTAT